jgi:hypothetical protein
MRTRFILQFRPVGPNGGGNGTSPVEEPFVLTVAC